MNFGSARGLGGMGTSPSTTRLSEATARKPSSGRPADDNRRRPARSSRSALVRRTLALSDCLALTISFVSAELLFLPTRPGAVDEVPATTEVPLFLATLPAWLLVAKLFGLYDRDQQRTGHSTTDDLVSIVNLVT